MYIYVYVYKSFFILAYMCIYICTYVYTYICIHVYAVKALNQAGEEGIKHITDVRRELAYRNLTG